VSVSPAGIPLATSGSTDARRATAVAGELAHVVPGGAERPTEAVHDLAHPIVAVRSSFRLIFARLAPTDPQKSVKGGSEAPRDINHRGGEPSGDPALRAVTAAKIGVAGVDWRRAEFVLTLLGFLGFITLPIRITTIYSGLPAHPLFVHIPVVLIPTTIVTAIVFMIKPEWFSRYGIALAVVSICAMSSVFLTLQAGAALRAALHLQGRAANLISQHAQAAHILAIVYVAFTATLIVTFAARRISTGMPTGLEILDRLLSGTSAFAALRIVLVLLSVGAGYMTFRTGDLGAKAVWAGRIQAAQAGSPGVPGLAKPSSGAP
jgi:hypothetical protein